MNIEKLAFAEDPQIQLALQNALEASKGLDKNQAIQLKKLLDLKAHKPQNTDEDLDDQSELALTANQSQFSSPSQLKVSDYSRATDAFSNDQSPPILKTNIPSLPFKIKIFEKKAMTAISNIKVQKTKLDIGIINGFLNANIVQEFKSTFGLNSIYYTVSKGQDIFDSERVQSNFQTPIWKEIFTFTLDSEQDIYFFDVYRHNSSEGAVEIDSFEVKIGVFLERLRDQQSHRLPQISQKDNAFDVSVRWRYDDSALKVQQIKKKIKQMSDMIKKQEDRVIKLKDEYDQLLNFKGDHKQLISAWGLQEQLQIYEESETSNRSSRILETSTSKNSKKPIGRISKSGSRANSQSDRNINNSNYDSTVNSNPNISGGKHSRIGSFSNMMQTASKQNHPDNANNYQSLANSHSSSSKNRNLSPAFQSKINELYQIPYQPKLQQQQQQQLQKQKDPEQDFSQKFNSQSKGISVISPSSPFLKYQLQKMYQQEQTSQSQSNSLVNSPIKSKDMEDLNQQDYYKMKTQYQKGISQGIKGLQKDNTKKETYVSRLSSFNSNQNSQQSTQQPPQLKPENDPDKLFFNNETRPPVLIQASQSLTSEIEQNQSQNLLKQDLDLGIQFKSQTEEIKEPQGNPLQTQTTIVKQKAQRQNQAFIQRVQEQSQKSSARQENDSKYSERSQLLDQQAQIKETNQNIQEITEKKQSRKLTNDALIDQQLVHSQSNQQLQRTSSQKLDEVPQIENNTQDQVEKSNENEDIIRKRMTSKISVTLLDEAKASQERIVHKMSSQKLAQVEQEESKEQEVKRQPIKIQSLKREEGSIIENQLNAQAFKVNKKNQQRAMAGRMDDNKDEMLIDDDEDESEEEITGSITFTESRKDKIQAFIKAQQNEERRVSQTLLQVPNPITLAIPVSRLGNNQQSSYSSLQNFPNTKKEMPHNDQTVQAQTNDSKIDELYKEIDSIMKSHENEQKEKQDYFKAYNSNSNRKSISSSGFSEGIGDNIILKLPVPKIRDTSLLLNSSTKDKQDFLNAANRSFNNQLNTSSGSQGLNTGQQISEIKNGSGEKEILAPTFENLKKMELKNHRRDMNTSIVSSGLNKALQMIGKPKSSVGGPMNNNYNPINKARSVYGGPTMPIGHHFSQNQGANLDPNRNSFSQSNQSQVFSGRINNIHPINSNHNSGILGTGPLGASSMAKQFGSGSANISFGMRAKLMNPMMNAMPHSLAFGQMNNPMSYQLNVPPQAPIMQNYYSAGHQQNFVPNQYQNFSSNLNQNEEGHEQSSNISDQKSSHRN